MILVILEVHHPQTKERHLVTQVLWRDIDLKPEPPRTYRPSKKKDTAEIKVSNTMRQMKSQNKIENRIHMMIANTTEMEAEE